MNIRGYQDEENVLISFFVCNKLCKRLPRLPGQTFAEQRTANGFAVSCPWYRGG